MLQYTKPLIEGNKLNYQFIQITKEIAKYLSYKTIHLKQKVIGKKISNSRTQIGQLKARRKALKDRKSTSTSRLRIELECRLDKLQFAINRRAKALKAKAKSATEIKAINLARDDFCQKLVSSTISKKRAAL